MGFVNEMEKHGWEILVKNTKAYRYCGRPLSYREEGCAVFYDAVTDIFMTLAA